MGEVVQNFPSYAAAAKNACGVLGKINPSNKTLYTGTLGEGKGKIVGIELYDRNGKKVARVRIDIDEPKGIHWNTEDWQSSTTSKTASCIESTRNTPIKTNAPLYADYLKGITNLEADTIWQWWKTGSKPT